MMTPAQYNTKRKLKGKLKNVSTKVLNIGFIMFLVKL